MEFGIECYKCFWKWQKCFLSAMRMPILPFMEDIVDSLVGSKSGSSYTAGTDLRYKVYQWMAEGGRMFIELGMEGG